MKYLVGERVYDAKTAEVSAALRAAHTIAWASELDEGETIYVLRDKGDWHSWARSAPALVQEKIDRANELAQKAQELENSDTSSAMAWQRLLVERTMSDMQTLAERFRLDPTSAELLKIAHEGASVLEEPVLRSVILTDHPGCGGATRPLPSGVPFPNLSWIGFNDRASGVIPFGSVTLWRHRWFRGRSAFLTGFGVCLSLLDIDFHNMASSAIPF